ncbi:MAG: hypothetical protein J5767_15050 [Paludibacteraceae bacterium]|nr:hypothetical protein [Paludibacteraceae bacterium]
MDSSHLNRFRDVVNEYGLILRIFRNCNGKNKWACICSAMDWIQIGLYGIDETSLERSNTDRASVKMITVVSCIDVMWEGIQQLHRVFFNTNGIPYKGNTEIFDKEIDDNRYWKDIRAAFAAHPTSLEGKEDGERRFASWSGGNFGKSGDFSVILYSNNPQKESEVFDISFSQILEFATSRYRYLNVLAVKVEEIKEQWLEKWRKTPVLYSGDMIDDIGMMIKENANRADNDSLHYRLEEIKQAFETKPLGEKNINAVNRYREALKNELQEIGKCLQEMDYEHEYQMVDDCAAQKYIYANQHIFEPEKGLVNWGVERLKEPLGQYIDLDDWETIDELQVIVRAGWWIYNQESE